MVKTADFGKPCAAPEPGRCRICGSDGGREWVWADETQTLCDRPACVAAARAEITTRPEEARQLMRPYEGKRYGFAPKR